MGYGSNTFGSRFRQNTAIIRNVALICEIIAKCIGFLLQVKYINIIMNNGDICMIRLVCDSFKYRPEFCMTAQLPL